MLFPALAVVAGVITLVIAVRTFDGMVVDDYYKEGRAIVQAIERTDHARELGLKASVRIADERLRLELSATDAVSLPETVLLTIAHPTRDGHDQVLRLSGPGGIFEAAIAPLSAGRWLFQIEDADGRSWKLNGAARLPAEAAFAIDSSAR
jgi:hypothetical protein